MTSHPSIMTRYAAFSASTHRELAQHANWMSSAEIQELAEIRDQQRRIQWTLGRRMAKRMVGDLVLATEWSAVEILSRHQGLGRRPQVRVDGDLVDWSLSISHTSRGVLVGLATNQEVSVGVDLATEVPADVQFRQMWFTPQEQRWLDEAPTTRTSILWALKEAVFKAGNTGQAWSPRQIQILPIDELTYQVTLFGHRLTLTSVDLRAIDGQTAATVCLPREQASSVDQSDVSVCL